MDTLAPVILEADPPNRSLHFEKNRIEIRFDEFVQLNNVRQELVVSPPLEEKPVVRIKKKTMIVDLKSALHENTTYTLNFGEAIADLNQGNVLENYEYVFSTGDYIDSLSVGGSLLYAFDLSVPEDPFMVMLYENLADSAPYREIPTYVGKSNKKGIYRINNLKSDTFRMFALKDANNNFMYDIPEEEIGFLDTLLVLDPAMFEQMLLHQDSLSGTAGKDTLQLQEDNKGAATGEVGPQQGDTTRQKEVSDSALLLSLNPYTVLADLRVFREDNKPQYLKDYNRTSYNKISLIFNRPLLGDIEAEPLNFSPAGPWYIRENHYVGDSVDYWLSDSLVYHRDTLKVVFSYNVTDSVMKLVEKLDTLKFIRSGSGHSRNNKKKDQGEQRDTVLSLTTGVSKGKKQDLYIPLTIEAKAPVAELIRDSIELTYKKDTVYLPQEFEIGRDSFYLRKFRLRTQWKEDVTCRLLILPGAFTDLYGLTNDSLDVTFRTQSSENYGTIILSVSGVENPLVVQLLKDKTETGRELFIEGNGSYRFSYLKPDVYDMKVIFDSNGNGKWDTGDYLGKRQPEKVVYYKGKVEIRANWEKEIIWNLEQ